MACPHTWTSQRVRQMVTVLLLLTTPLSQPMKVLKTFTDPDSNLLQELEVHAVTGDVYVGATNRLHRLSWELALLQTAETGPQQEDPNCPPPPLPCPLAKQLRDSATKGLAVDYSDDTLLVCSTLPHGACRKVAVNNVTEVVRVFDKPLVPPQEPASCVLFLGPSLGGQQAVYIGAEHSSGGHEELDHLVPSISSRDLMDLDLVFQDADGGTQKFIKDSLRASYAVRYIHGFTDGGFAYFVTVQREDPNSTDVVSRISRVCTRDKYFRSFVEIPFRCEDSLKAFQVLQDAVVLESSRQLYAVFGESVDSSWKVGNSSSVLCVVDLDVVDQEFNRTVEECHAGSGHVGPSHYEDVTPCRKTAD